MAVRLDITAALAYGVISDPERLRQTNPAIRAMRLLSDPQDHDNGGLQRLSSDVRLCAGPFCRTLHQVQDMHFEPAPPDEYHITATVIPEHSDLRYGIAQWAFASCGENGLLACLKFDAELEPDFWIPPLIGPWLVRRTLHEQALETCAGIERVARQLEASFAVTGP